MRRRFILTIALFFIGATASISYLQFHYFEKERMSLIDQQIDRTASVILSSNLSVAALSGREEIEDLIYETLEDEPLNQFIVLRDEAGAVLYRNQVAEDLGISLPPAPAKQLVEASGHLLRYASYALPRSTRVLQLGLVLDQRQILWNEIKWKALGFTGALTILLILISILLANYLLRPLKELALYFEYQATSPEAGKPMPAFTRDSPEFLKLAKSVQNATERWQSLLRHHGSLLARLAHEIRTPLTIATNKLERMRPENVAKLRDEAAAELRHAENITREFMSWSRLEYAPAAEPEVYAIPIVDFVGSLACIKEGPANLVLENKASQGEKVFAKPEHLRLIFENLVENARRYGAPDQPIVVRIEDTGFEVVSFGAEIASSVRENFGKPFNRGSERSDSTGIGIANVISVCKRYDWRLSYSHQVGLNVFRISYPR